MKGWKMSMREGNNGDEETKLSGYKYFCECGDFRSDANIAC